MHFHKSLILLPAIGLGNIVAHAQDLNLAYNMSNLTVQGTARSMGFGNALGSIGGDFSSASVNPAGLGVYRSSEFTLTPTLRMNGTNTSYLGEITSDNNVRFNFNNFGMVFTDAPKGKRYDRRSWKAVSFAFGMNRVADFNRNYAFAGNNYSNSATHAFEADANQYPADPVSTSPLSVPGYIGYQAYLLNINANGDYYSTVPVSGGIRQDKFVRERGRINEYAISLGGNYQEQLMVGATLGIPSVKYDINSTFSESLSINNTANNPDKFNYFNYTQNLKVTGTGVNLKIGAIYKVNNNIRIGGAFHTPTVYALNETYTPSINSNLGNTTTVATVDNGILASNRFDYSFVSPWRGILSGSYIMKGKGFITLDYEYIGYNSMSFIYPVGDGYGNNYEQQEQAMNRSIKNTYQGTSNVRIGAEALLTKYFMLRAGFGYYSNPYKANGMGGERMDFSGGLGFRGTNGFFADLGFVHSAYQVQAAPYSIDYNYVVSSPISTVPMYTTDYSINNIAMTVGVKF
jgi:hypothetical protein